MQIIVNSKKVIYGMNRNLILAAVLGFIGLMILAYSVLQGEANAGIVIIFPVFYGSGLFAFLGVLCIMGAMILGFVGYAEQAEKRQGHEPGSDGKGQGKSHGPVKGGGVVLIGPIPIIFGSDPKTAVVLVVFALIIMVAAIILIYFSLL
jgi:uncharacterized protein (TIGR00304 family)